MNKATITKYAISVGATVLVLGLVLAGSVGFDEAIELVKCAWNEGCTVMIPETTN